MDNEEAHYILSRGRGGVGEWNRRRRNGRDLPSLASMHLSEVDLSGANLSGLNLQSAHFADCNLTNVDFSGADLSGAKMPGCKFSRTSLSNASLRGARLERAELVSVIVDGTDFSECVFGETVLASVDLSKAVNIDQIIHHAPSAISVDTLIESAMLPEIFLRSCGIEPSTQAILRGDPRALSDAAYRAAEGQSLNLESCFISYTEEDEGFASDLHKALNERGVTTWFAPVDGRWGERLDQQIDREIAAVDRLLVVCSEKSLASRWVRFEIRKAIAEEARREKQVLFPLAVDRFLFEWNHPNGEYLRETLVANFVRVTSEQDFNQRVERLVTALNRDTAGIAKSRRSTR